jgi:adenylate cyclase
VVGVVGEAGVGKSRLCEEFAASAAARGITVRRTAGISHGGEVPLLPILSLLRDYFGISQADSSEEAREKVAAYLRLLDPSLEETLPLLYDFLEVPDPGCPAPQLAAEVRMRRLFEALRRITQRRSEREVLVLLCEDLHWFDSQSEAFLERLLESFPGSRTVVLTNFRPEFSAPWMRHSYYRQLPLAPLRGEAASELLTTLLGADASLTPLRRFVLERTGGNPFFIEEVVWALVEDGTLAGAPGNYRLTHPLDAVNVPPSVQAVLAARIDRLPAEHKDVLQTAAVIGRSFAGPVLAEVVAVAGEDLEDTLRALCATELLQETGADSEYRFWHPLTQEVAYGSLLSERRARIHGAVGTALEQHEADRLDELAAVLAWHWERAGRHVESARWSVRAGSWAVRSDLAEAQRRWRTALRLLADVDETPESFELGVRARMRLLWVGARTGIEPEEAERLYAEGRNQAERLGDLGVLVVVVSVAGTVRFFAGDPEGALVRYVEAARLAEQASEPALVAVASLGVSCAFAYVGPLDEGLAWADRGILSCAGDPELGAALVGYSPLVRLHQFRAVLRARMGHLAEAHADAEHAVALARSRSEPETLAWALAVLAELASLTGEDDDPLSLAGEARQIGEETGNASSLVLGLAALGLVHLCAGRPTEASAACERALREAQTQRSGRFEEAALLSHLAQARLLAGDPANAIATADDAVAVARAQGARVVECLALLSRAQVFRATGGTPNAVLADLDAALALVKKTGALTYEPFVREELARQRGDMDELREALRLYNEIGATGHERRLEAELAGSPRSAWAKAQRS